MRPDNNNIVVLNFYNGGEFPLYDVVINIEDLDKALEVSKPLDDKFDKTPFSLPEFYVAKAQATQTIHVGNLSPHTVQHNFLVIPPCDSRRYQIWTVARNGSSLKLLHFEKVQGTWKVASRDFRNGKVIRESIDNDFPINPIRKLW